MMKQNVILVDALERELTAAIDGIAHDKLFVLTDTTTVQLCWPLVKGFGCMSGAMMITIGSTDEAKNLNSLAEVWAALQLGGASRHSLMVNLGGGMVTDLGGFAASTFKRGMAYINVPTTLLAQVDASVGGKTGINFGGLKNEIGVFNCAGCVLLSGEFLRTLDRANLLSGYAEMLKHGLLDGSGHLTELLAFDIEEPDYVELMRLVGKSVAIKEAVVTEDPTERGVRKALNLGHTVGHAIESLALSENRTVLHGYAVAWGLVMELYLSVRRCGFPSLLFHQIEAFVREHYGRFEFECRHYDVLYDLMTHDKKNQGGVINFTLLGGVGDIRIDQSASKAEIEEMLDYYREN